MDALEVEEQREFLRGLLRPQDRDFTVHERRKRGFRPPFIIDNRTSIHLNGSKDSSRQKTDDEPDELAGSSHQNKHSQQDSQQMQQCAVLAAATSCLLAVNYLLLKSCR